MTGTGAPIVPEDFFPIDVTTSSNTTVYGLPCWYITANRRPQQPKRAILRLLLAKIVCRVSTYKPDGTATFGG